MSKRKILLMALALCMVAILAVGGTLAYLTDEEVKHNVFTVGNVDIELIEDFDQGSKLLPDIAVDKVVTVKNVGTEEAYVRVHIGIPTYWREDVTATVKEPRLSYIIGEGSDADGEWVWYDTTYTTELEGVEYTVFVATYTTELASGEETATAAIEQVLFHKLVTNDLIQAFVNEHEEIKILVAAEGGQAAGFKPEAPAAATPEIIKAALETQFGVPGEYDVDFTVPDAGLQ